MRSNLFLLCPLIYLDLDLEDKQSHKTHCVHKASWSHLVSQQNQPFSNISIWITSEN